MMKYQEGGDARALADRIATAQSLRALGDAWLEISANDAQTIAAAVLSRELTHSEEIMPEADAIELADAFIDLAPEPHTYFTNGDWADAMRAGADADDVGFDPISDSTFDAGIICVGEGVVSILWVEDED